MIRCVRASESLRMRLIIYLLTIQNLSLQYWHDKGKPRVIGGRKGKGL
jgi:hypothetical protein